MESMAESNKFHKWLSNEITESEDKRYRHRLLKEKPGCRDDVFDKLKEFVQNAHEDARRYLRKPLESLDPLEQLSASDPANGYPELLYIDDLKGCFGEIFAGLIAEHFSPLGHTWRVPAFLFRFHLVAFQMLEKKRQTGEKATKVLGRTGDDCLAFQLGSKGQIVRSLVCESKCTKDHSSNSISKAHEKVSEDNPRPVDIRQIIDILEDRDDPESAKWIDPLSQLLLRDSNELRDSSSGYERCDFVCYVCGRSPRLGDRKTWMSTTESHEKYTGERRLEAVETHLNDVDGLVREIYGKEDETNG